MRAMSLDKSGKEKEDNEMCFLRERLDVTNNLVLALSTQLDMLKDSVSSHGHLSIAFLNYIYY
jgi:hypothetical protein